MKRWVRPALGLAGGLAYGAFGLLLAVVECWYGYCTTLFVLLFCALPGPDLWPISVVTLGFWGLVGLLVGLLPRRVPKWTLAGLMVVFYAGAGVAAVLGWPFSPAYDHGLSLLWHHRPEFVVTAVLTFAVGQAAILRALVRSFRGHPNDPRPLYQFRLRTLLLLPLLLALPLGWFVTEVRRARRYDAAVAELEKRGVFVWNDNDVGGEDPLGFLSGGSFFKGPASVRLERDASVADRDLAYLPDLGQVLTVSIPGSPITDAGMKHLASLKTLHVLDIKNANVSDDGIAILHDMPYLWRVDLSGTAVTDAGLDNLQEGLEEISLARTPVTDAGLSKLPRSVRDLDLSGTRVTDAGIGKLPDVSRLLLADTEISDNGVAKLVGQRRSDDRLYSLDLSRTNVTDVALAHLGQTDSLCHLGLAGTRISDEGLDHLAAHGRLFELDLSETDVTDAGLRRLGELAAPPRWDERRPDSWMMEWPEKFPRRLEWLNLARTKITDAGLEYIRQVPIERLNLSGTGVTDAGISHLAPHGFLTDLDLSDTEITDAGLKRLGELAAPPRWDEPRGNTGSMVDVPEEFPCRLESLNLARTNITDAGLQYIRYVPVGRLNLAGTNITDAGIAHLVTNWLDELTLDDTPVTDGVVPALSKMNVLKFLSIRSTRITPAGYRRLLQALPQTKIEYDGEPEEP